MHEQLGLSVALLEEFSLSFFILLFDPSMLYIPIRGMLIFSIFYIADQGHCGSCWAFGAVESLSDRLCSLWLGKFMLIKGTLAKFHFNNDVLACCGFLCGDGCNGGSPISAWQYFVRKGVVTEKCDPYFDNIGCSHPGCEPTYPTPQRNTKCVKENLLRSESKHFGVDAYGLSWDPYSIIAEVYKNGPLEVAFSVYEVRRMLEGL